MRFIYTFSGETTVLLGMIFANFLFTYTQPLMLYLSSTSINLEAESLLSSVGLSVVPGPPYRAFTRTVLAFSFVVSIDSQVETPFSILSLAASNCAASWSYTFVLSSFSSSLLLYHFLSRLQVFPWY